MDLDNDGITEEPLPFDLALNRRIADGDCNRNSIVDMGAYEYKFIIEGDLDDICGVDFADMVILSQNWQKESFTAGDIDGDGSVDIADLAILAANWLKGAGE